MDIIHVQQKKCELLSSYEYLTSYHHKALQLNRVQRHNHLGVRNLLAMGYESYWEAFRIFERRRKELIEPRFDYNHMVVFLNNKFNRQTPT